MPITVQEPPIHSMEPQRLLSLPRFSGVEELFNELRRVRASGKLTPCVGKLAAAAAVALNHPESVAWAIEGQRYSSTMDYVGLEAAFKAYVTDAVEA